LRGAGERIETTLSTNFRANLFDLLTAYARQRQKSVISKVTLRQRSVWSLAEAREALERLAGAALEWTVLDDFLLQFCVDPATARTVRASAFSASLEMVREGRFHMRQDQAFSAIWVRRREPETGVDALSFES
jgi:segregation and condensation protein A